MVKLARMRIIRDHGSHHKYDHVVMGHNYRMEALQGAFLRVKLRHLPAWTAARRERAEWYQYGLASISQINCPKIHPKANPVWHLYVVQAEDREELQQHLASCGISTGLHYPVPLDRQPAFAAYDSANGSYPRSDAAVSTLLSLPMFPEMTKEQSDHVIASIKLFYQFSA
jgi:dTDP-4-amino-4,6-dideoxygalactose transaminase